MVTVEDDPDVHARVIKRTREGWTRDHFPIPVGLVEERVSEICGVPLTTYHEVKWSHHFYLRMIRLGQLDFNPPHRDVWLDFYRHGVNIFFPISWTRRFARSSRRPFRA